MLEPFAPLRERDRELLEGEGESLAALVASREPGIYRRYRQTRRRR